VAYTLKDGGDDFNYPNNCRTRMTIITILLINSSVLFVTSSPLNSVFFYLNTFLEDLSVSDRLVE
jgi:hypothetical protein